MATSVMTMYKFIASPREEHLSRVKRIFVKNEAFSHQV